MASHEKLPVCPGPKADGPKRFRFFLRLTSHVLLLTLLFVSVVNATWVQQQSGTTAFLKSVYFIDAQTGWVAGDTNFILRTTDAGSHWERHVVDSLRWGADVIRFWDSNLGFVGGRQYLNKSTDGGLTWRYITQSLWGFIFNIVSVTPLKGWAVSGAFASGDGGAGCLYQTTDRGETWVKRDSSNRYVFRDVGFADSLFGWLTADNHGFSIPSDGYMNQTTDGGATWETIARGAFGPVRFLGRNFAWRTFFYGYVTHGWGIDKTTDQGAHWIRIYSSAYGGCSCGWDPRLAVTDSLKGWFLLRYTDTLMVTHDGGASWSKQVPPGSYKMDVFFTDSLNGWLVGSQGLILHTTDGGSGVWSKPSRLTPYASRLTASPNPFVSYTTVPGQSTERFVLYDISGRRVGTYKGDRIGEGLSPGVYFLKPEGEGAQPLRIVKLR